MPYPRTIVDAYMFSPYAAFWSEGGRPKPLPKREQAASPFASRQAIDTRGPESTRSLEARGPESKRAPEARGPESKRALEAQGPESKRALEARCPESKRGLNREPESKRGGASSAGASRGVWATLTTPRLAWYPKAVDTAEQLVQSSLAGDRDAVRALVDRVGPVIQARVARVAARGRSRQGEQLRQIVADLTQEVFVSLFQEQGRVLRGWTPARGLSLEAYVGMVAEHQAISFLRSGRRSGWREDATGDQELELSAGGHSGIHERVYARQTLTRLLDRMREVLSPKGLTLFELLVVEERSVIEVCEAMSMSADAVYAWRSRLAKTASTLLAELESEDGAAPKKATPGQRG